jgi:uncharacterized damage-inducible protein DinB
MNAGLAQAFRYNRWANQRILEACRGLTDHQLDTSVPGTGRTIRELLIHVVSSQLTFVLRTKGRQHEGEASRLDPWPGIDEVIAAAQASSDELVDIAAALDEDVEVGLPWQGKVYRYPKSFFLAHALEHGTEHRTEMRIGLEIVGAIAPELDGWEFATSAGYGTETQP